MDDRILIGAGLFAALGSEAARRVRPGPALLVTDRNVAAHHLDPARRSLREAGFVPEPLVLPPGEATKSLSRLRELYDALLALGADRRTPVIAVGGGVITDLAGFAAATFLRGLPFLAVPTSLLAQVDASVGGKTGVNLPEGKNLVGAFHQPSLVVIDPRTLATLPSRHLVNGMAEVAKIALCLDADLLRLLEEDPGTWGEVAAAESWVSLIRAAVERKCEVVRADEREAGPRRVLNFGHTAGHALEAAAGYGSVLHGEAVAVGIVAALRISVRRGLLDPAVEERSVRLLAGLGLPVSVEGLAERPDREAVAAHLVRDKKRVGARLALVLLTGPGRAVIVEDGSAEEVLDAIP